MAELSLTKQAGILTTTESLRFLVKTIIGIMLARALSIEEYGSYRQLFLIYTTFSTVLLLGIPQSLLYFIPKLSGKQELSEYVSRIIDMVSILGILLGALILVSKGIIGNRFANPQLTRLLTIYAAYPVFMLVSQVFSSIMMGMRQAYAIARFTVFTIVSETVIVLGTAVLTKDLYAIVLSLVVSAFIQWIYVRINLRKFMTAYRFEREFYKNQFSYSLPLGLSSIIGILAVQLDKIVISGYFSPQQFAIFSIGAMELPFIGIFVNSINSVLLPVFSSGKSNQDISQIYRGAVRKNSLFIFPIAAVFFVLSNEIITLLYTVKYAEAAHYFRIYLFTLIVRIASYGILFQALNKTKLILANSLFTLLFNLILNIILVNSSLGISGPAIATVVVTYISVVFYLFWIEKVLFFKVMDLFPMKQLFLTMLASVISAFATYHIITIIDIALIRLIIGSAVFVILYLGLAIALKAILPYDIANMISLVKRYLDLLKRHGS